MPESSSNQPTIECPVCLGGSVTDAANELGAAIDTLQEYDHV